LGEWSVNQTYVVDGFWNRSVLGSKTAACTLQSNGYDCDPASGVVSGFSQQYSSSISDLENDVDAVFFDWSQIRFDVQQQAILKTFAKT
jgi:hypothetical protein